MLAYSAQDLILEPFAGTVFGFTPGESTSLSGVQHGGVLLGMILVALVGSRFANARLVRRWLSGISRGLSWSDDCRACRPTLAA